MPGNTLSIILPGKVKKKLELEANEIKSKKDD